MRKKLYILIRIIFCIYTFYPILAPICIEASELSTKDFTPKSSKEKVVGFTRIGSWNNGNFFETITYELVGFDDEAMTMKYRFRYYITHKGGSGSYIYQKVPVGVFLDNKKIAAFSSWIDKHISNKTQLCGEKTVTIKSGTHVVELRDIKDGAITVVNVTKSVHIPIPSYTVRFLDQDGTVLKTQTVERYKDAEAPPVSDKTGKTFTGWDKPFHYVREDLVITAQYATNTYSVNFIDWNGSVLKSQSVKHGESASPPPSPTREGHTFQGWIGDYTNVTGNRTITASYKILTFTITFDSNGGTPVSSQIITYGDKVGYPAEPVKKKNKFMGWFTASGTKYDFQQPVKSSMTLYAHWDEEPVITTKDIHIFEDLYTEQEWKKVRLEQVKAMDKEDGDISDRLTVLNDTTNLHKQGQYSITYQVKDNAGNTVSKEGRVFVLDKRPEEDRMRKYIRSISGSYMQTLHADSLWRATDKFERLTQTLQKNTAQAKHTWRLKAEDIAKIRAFNASHGYSQQANRQFLEEFSYLRR